MSVNDSKTTTSHPAHYSLIRTVRAITVLKACRTDLGESHCYCFLTVEIVLSLVGQN